MLVESDPVNSLEEIKLNSDLFPASHPQNPERVCVPLAGSTGAMLPRLQPPSLLWEGLDPQDLGLCLCFPLRPGTRPRLLPRPPEDGKNEAEK